MHKASPKVTVCAVSFNSGYLTELGIRSVLENEYPNLELFCIDDGSADSSPDLLAKLAEELRFEFIRSEENVGIAATLNKALSRASGDYIMFIGDDLVLPNRIQGDVDILMGNSGISFVCGSAKIIGWDGLPLDGFSDWSTSCPDGPFQENAEKVWLRGSRIFTPCVTYRTQTLRDLDGWEAGYDIEDKPLFLKFAKKGISGWGRNEVTTLYRRHEGNYSAKFKVNMFHQEQRFIVDFGLSIPPWKVSVKFLIEAHYWMLFLGASSSQVAQAFSLAGKSSLSWTTRSRLFKVAYLALTFFRTNRYVERNIRYYLRNKY